MVDTPALDKAAELATREEILVDFLNWLFDRGIVLGVVDRNGEIEYANQPVRQLIADFLGIDLDKMESERRGLLAELRLVHKMAERRTE